MQNRRTGSDNNVFTQAGFTRADAPVKRRIIMAIEGREKSGKDHFALSAPGPIALFDFDIGLDGVIQKWQDEKEIYTHRAQINMQALKEMPIERAANEAEKAWDKITSAYQSVLGHARTIVVDTGTEMWDLLRMARFGKLDHVKPHHYGPVNAEYRDFIRMAYDQDRTNLILLHKVKNEYVDDKSTGRLIRAGFSDTGFLVQMNATCYRGQEETVPECFHMTINDCRQNPELSGIDVSGAELNFPFVATQVFPDTSEEDWI